MSNRWHYAAATLGVNSTLDSKLVSVLQSCAANTNQLKAAEIGQHGFTPNTIPMVIAALELGHFNFKKFLIGLPSLSIRKVLASTRSILRHPLPEPPSSPHWSFLTCHFSSSSSPPKYLADFSLLRTFFALTMEIRCV